MQNKRVELLAPAGNAEGFYGAVHAGADAVYLGGNRFGARAYADNFTTEELVSCIRYAHLWGRKVYLTVNTLVKESEFQDIYEYLLPYYEAGLDGVIVQDIGVFAYIRDHFPDIELHVSTQMTLTGVYGAKLLQEMGACRIVPARELSLEEIRHIKEKTGLSIEAFIHGAMCYCYSGQCLFSSILGGRSGNRGRCAQPCRLPYQVEFSRGKATSQGRASTWKKDEYYPLSLKDMCTIEHIPELIEAGIDSFKIEGRMKKPEYAAGVTAIYRKYIDRVYNTQMQSKSQNFIQKNNFIAEKIKIDAEDMRKLSHLYIRGEIQNGYYHKHNDKDMVTLTSPAYSGSDEALLSEIRQKYLEQKPKRSISVYADFTTGQNATVTFVCGELSVTAIGNQVETASRQPITKENIAKQLGKLGDSIFTADSMEITAGEDAFYPLRAINELRREAVTKLENTLIEQNGFSVYRKDAIPELSNVQEDAEPGLMEHQKKIIADAKENSMSLKGDKKPSARLFLSIRRKEQLQAVYDLIYGNQKKNPPNGRYTAAVHRIYLDSKLFEMERDNCLAMCRDLAGDCELVISLPYVIRENDYHFLQNVILPLFSGQNKTAEDGSVFKGIQIRSLEGMGMVKNILRKNTEYPVNFFTDVGFYIWNKAALAECTKMGNTQSDIMQYETMESDAMRLAEFCLPLELKGVEQRKLTDSDIPCEKIMYGRAPMMLTANCVAKTMSGCLKASGEQVIHLVDRYHKKFPVELNCRQCMNIIYNSVPLSLHGELGRWSRLADLRLDFTVENAHETRSVIEYFAECIVHSGKGKLPNPPYAEYTTGHEKRGVE